MEIKNSQPSDFSSIFNLYDQAVQLQMQRQMVVWPKFEESLVEQEIREQRQWKMLVDGEIACIWAIAFQDKDIWEERENGQSIYIHRIATNPAFRGRRLIDGLVAWAKGYASSMGRSHIRLDTLGNNTRLIEHYTSAGFSFLGIVELTKVDKLPAHYQKERNCCLFEIEVA